MQPILSIRNLTVNLKHHTIISNLSFDVQPGDNLTIIGPNGSGKTVLLKTILGGFIYEGEIKIAPGIKIGYVPQKIEADLHLPINLGDFLHAKARIIGEPASEIKAVVDSVGLDKEIFNKPIGQLSGGQFQRALVAFALLGKPNLILFDEPTASIDQTGEEQIYELIHKLQKQYKLTVVLVSHDISIVYQYATKVLCLNREGVCYGTPRKTLNPEVLKKLYGVPHQYYEHKHPHK
ncbi:MAG: metal ABC transporter ATP-binding protein [Candidatus Paceibacterota bacterium]|jgi:zinc transport system ATP-binding protein